MEDGRTCASNGLLMATALWLTPNLTWSLSNQFFSQGIEPILLRIFECKKYDKNGIIVLYCSQCGGVVPKGVWKCFLCFQRKHINCDSVLWLEKIEEWCCETGTDAGSFWLGCPQKLSRILVSPRPWCWCCRVENTHLIHRHHTSYKDCSSSVRKKPCCTSRRR